MTKIIFLTGATGNMGQEALTLKLGDLEEVLSHSELSNRSVGKTIIFKTDDLLSVEPIAAYLGIENRDQAVG